MRIQAHFLLKDAITSRGNFPWDTATFPCVVTPDCSCGYVTPSSSKRAINCTAESRRMFNCRHCKSSF
jgi:hypothetical protein